MVLLDHFHPPLSALRHWHSFHNAWAMMMATDLNQYLPKGYFAEPNVQFGVEIDVAALKSASTQDAASTGNSQWHLEPPNQTIPFQPDTDKVEITIFNSQAGSVLVGSIELVSPANKDRQAHRDKFVSKCETFLNQGIGLVIIDIVTERRANLHHQLLQRVGNVAMPPPDSSLFATAYRPVEQDGQTSLDIWHETLVVGQKLPTMPLWLRGELCVPIRLHESYEQTCKNLRIPPENFS